tara:strand:- start:6065 stop:6277 length:213 start_codon:yes stop_codon:yes gene_type:complete
LTKLKQTQKELVTDHLRNVGSISNLEALSLYRIVHLPKVISKLIRDNNFSIRKEYKYDNTGARYLRYHSA